MDATRALLDELMGKERNVPLTERSNRRIRFDDPSVCKHDLAGLCPHGLFKNTRSDLGPCQYELHTDHIDWPGIKEDFDKQDDREKERYEKKLMRYLEDLIREMDRKIAKSKERADKESAPKPIKGEDQARLDEMQGRAKDALEKSQRLGEEGDVDQAMMLSQQAEHWQRQYDELYKRLSTPDRTMSVCEVCGVFVNSVDGDERKWGGKVPQPILDHLNGKQYLGWKAIRDQFAKLREKYSGANAAPDREKSEPKDVRERERSPRKEEPSRREERPREDRDRSYDRDRDRGYDRDRDRGYDRDRDRSRGGSDYGGSRGGSGRDGYSSRGYGSGSAYSSGGRDRGYSRGEERRY